MALGDLLAGSFNGQVYVQPLTSGVREINLPSTTTALSNGHIDMPRIRWRPYIATGMASTTTSSASSTVEVVTHFI
jgi:hypothetical protein